MPATLTSLAAQLGLSHTTVAKILKEDPKFSASAKTRERVKALADELRYRPTLAGRHLQRGSTLHIGLLLHDLYDPYFAAIAHGVGSAAAAEGYSLVLGVGRPNHGGYAGSFDPTEWYIDGLVAGLFGYFPEGALQRWNSRMPVVAIGRTKIDAISQEPAVPFVDCDQATGAALVGNHLVEQGCRRIAYVGWADPEREGGLQAGVEAAGHSLQESIHCSDGEYPVDVATRWEQVQRTLAERLSSPKPFPDGLFCYNDAVAAYALSLLRRHGLRVPEDVCVVGFNDDPESRYRELPLTSVSVPLQEVCAAAVRSVVGRLRGEQDVTERLIMTPSLVVRESSTRVAPIEK